MTTNGEFPRPPGFEDENDINEAELAEFTSFMAGKSEKPGYTTPVVDALSDKRQLHRGRGSGLTGESTATVEITPWKEDGVEAPGMNLIDEDANFEEEKFSLGENLLRGVYEMGFVKPSKIQAASLPLICKGGNMIGQAQNGSGKTATFSLALLSRLEIANEWPQALVVCPTRELARQIETVISQLGQYLPVKTLLVVPSQERIARNAKCHVVVGTPGKIFDLAKKRIVDLSWTQIFVLDEADMMLDQENMMGPQVTEIRKLLPREVQVLFFSATFPDDVRAFAENLVPRATSIKVKKEELTVSSVAQMYMRCNDEWDKFTKLSSLYGAMNVGQSVIFVNQRKKAFQLSKWMRDGGFAVSLICGTQTTGEERMDPALRDHVMDEFRNGVTRVLIATDVLARGIDVPQVTLVVNYEVPINYADRLADMETYLHRVGRTGRFGLKGIAVNLVTDKERDLVDQVCSFFECKIEEMHEDFEALEERLKMLR
jgi:ATP-dependent RNA helicase DDX19/DBP5